MANTTVPQSVRVLLDDFAPCFTKPGFKIFATMITGWITCQGRHSISRVIQAGSSFGKRKHHSSFYRFLAKGSWCTDAVGRVIFRLLLPFLSKEITLILDDTLNHKSGPHIFGAAMHYDSHQSTYGRGTAAGSKGFFAFGHNWLVAAIWLPLPWNAKRGLAIPILFRLYRSKKGCPAKKYRKRTEMARDLVDMVETWIPDGQQLHVIADSEYACQTLVKNIPKTMAFTGPMSMDAALYAQPQPQLGRGRPRVKGIRLPSPKKLAESTSIRWKLKKLFIYGREVEIKVKSQICMWYTVAGTRELRMIVTRDPNGRINDRAYFTTNAECSECEIMIQFARRWEIEVAFRNTKQAMGLEHPQNGWWRRKSGSRRPKKRAGPNAKEKIGEKAVSHTLSMAFVAYALVVIWYLRHGCPEQDVARIIKEVPWYKRKKAPSFNDMLAAMRRKIWASRISQHPACEPGHEKIEDILPHWLLAA